jgi:uncharacterized protein
MAEREVLSWELFGTAAWQLAASVVADGFAPDLILAIDAAGCSSRARSVTRWMSRTST